MAQMQTKTISFHEVTDEYPTLREIRNGVYALNKMSGDLVKIPKDSIMSVCRRTYSMYAPASAFPSATPNPYAQKYDDLVRAKDVLKNNRWSGDGYEIGRAIGLIKRFLETHGKV
jgi:hypothetical protein